MEYSLATQLIAEFLGTAIMVLLGNGSVANVELEGTKGHHGSWLIIAIGYGMGVMIPALMIGSVSGNYINPAFVIGMASVGSLAWGKAMLFIVVEFLGAMAGQLVVVAMHKPYYDKTTNPTAILGTFSTIENAGSKLNGFISEFFGSFVLFFGALALTHNTFNGKADLEVAHIGLGFLVMALVASMGGPTGPALNPARDLGPRILHAILPLKNKGGSQWDYAAVPVIAPILAAIAAAFAFKGIFGL